MTRRKFKKMKNIRMFLSKYPDLGLEKPLEAEPEKAEKASADWKIAFLRQMPWNKTRIS